MLKVGGNPAPSPTILAPFLPPTTRNHTMPQHQFKRLALISLCSLLSACAGTSSPGVSRSPQFEALAQSTCQQLNTSRATYSDVTAIKTRPNNILVKGYRHYSVINARFTGTTLRFTEVLAHNKFDSINDQRSGETTERNHAIPLEQVSHVTVKKHKEDAGKMSVSSDLASLTIQNVYNVMLSTDVIHGKKPAAWEEAFFTMRPNVVSADGSHQALNQTTKIPSSSMKGFALLCNFPTKESANRFATDIQQLAGMLHPQRVSLALLK